MLALTMRAIGSTSVSNYCLIGVIDSEEDVVFKYILYVQKVIKANQKINGIPKKIFINSQDNSSVKRYCREIRFDKRKQPKLLMKVNGVPVYVDPLLEKGIAAYQTDTTTAPEIIRIGLDDESRGKRFTGLKEVISNPFRKLAKTAEGFEGVFKKVFGRRE